jgi:hypothetical protein
VTTLQNALREHHITSLRVLKMDIEGAEGIVLPKSQDILQSGMIEVLLLELHVDLIQGFGRTGDDIIRLLQNSNYGLYLCHGTPLREMPEDWKTLVDGSGTIHILALHKRSMESGKLPRIWN